MTIRESGMNADATQHKRLACTGWAAMNRILASAAFSAIAFSALATATPAQPAFTSDPSKVETEAQDQICQRDLDTACGRLNDKRTQAATDKHACQRLADQEPRCLGYPGFRIDLSGYEG
jgi:hypothetical protein